MKKLLFVVSLIYNTAFAVTVKDYIELRRTGSEHNFLSGYIEALEDSIYLFGGCERLNSPSYLTAYNAIKLELDLAIETTKIDIMEESLNLILIPMLKERMHCKGESAIKTPTTFYQKTAKSIKKDVCTLF